ncbi:MAG TPA: hypothetical protein VG347_00010 [Verrucomicrobiae bacterium]|nr:hypothetical protein [Verrucomicrobiae bacterium]
MKCLKRLTVLWLSCLTGNFMVHAGDLPSRSIPAVASGSPTQSTNLPTITANGVMTLLGKKQVLFQVAGPLQFDGSSGDSSYVLEVGEGRNGIKVVSVDDDSKTVTFDNHGTVQEIALKTAALVSAPVSVQPPVMTLQSGSLQSALPPPPAALPVEEPQNDAGPIIITVGSHPTAPVTRFPHHLGLALPGNQSQFGGAGFAPPPLSANNAAAVPSAPAEVSVPVMNQAPAPPRSPEMPGGLGGVAPALPQQSLTH